nr:hypothetical protein [Tibeticola sp.]
MSDASSSPAAPRDEPLHLTVHEVPLALEPAAPDARALRRGRLKMLLLFLVCIAPVVASYLTYYVFRPQSRHSYGELIDPQRPLPDLVVRDLDGAPVSLPSLKNQWLLITVASGACDSRCQDHLYLQRQLRESLGKDKDRLDRVWLIPDDAPVPPALLPALAQATVLRVPGEALAKWLAPAPGHALDEHFYVVDPLGNWMMRFPASLDASTASKARRDLDRLMRASASWDEAGRPQAAQ